MRTRGVYVLNKEAWTNTRLCDTACHPAQKDAYLLKSVRIEHRAISTIRYWNSELARECSGICTVQGPSS